MLCFRDERVHLGTMTNLATKPVETMFPAVRWWLLGDELRFSGPESEAARALQYVGELIHIPRCFNLL